MLKIHDIPYEASNDKGLSYIGRKIGKPLPMDSWTVNMCAYVVGKSTFAHVLVEVPTRPKWMDVVKIRIPNPLANTHSLHSLDLKYA